MTKPTAKDLDLTYDSDYLTGAYYDELLQDRDDALALGPSDDFGLVAECKSLLNFEARLLDQERYREWLDLYSCRLIYWVPYSESANIRSHINMMFDDRRRLEDRILRLLSQHAHTLAPDRRFQHVVSNVEAWQLRGDKRRVLASQVAYEYRPEHDVVRHVFRSDHTLRLEDGTWKIAVKRCVLLNRDAAIEPPTLL
jgi:benzoate/toluate 1,2-dioxygenase beta subunit